MKLSKYKLGDLVEVTRGMSLSGQYYAEEGKLVRLTLGNFNLNGGGFKENTSKSDLYFTGEVKDEYVLKKGDIITPLTEQTVGLLGSTARIPISGKYIHSQDIALVRCKEGKMDSNFCYYLISSNLVRQQLSVAAQQTKIRHTSPDKIKNCIVYIPPLDCQKNIGNFLTQVDKLIAFNKAINHNLEAMAKQLYDYWFVQFDFPDENGKPYKSSGGRMVWNEKLKRDIPEGWEVEKIGSILDKYPSTKKYESKEYLKQGTYPIIDQGDAYIVGFTNDKDNLLTRYPAVLFGDHSTHVKLLDFPFARGADGTQILYSKHPNISQYYLYFVVLSLPIPNPGYSRHFKYLKDLPIVVPNKELANNFQQIVTHFFIQIKGNIFANINLTKLRDELLPLLMNGQVSVNYDLQS